MAAEGDLIQINDFQDYLGQEVLNTYYYRLTLGGASLVTPYTVLASSFANEVDLYLVKMQSALLSHVLIEVRNLSNGLDIYSVPNSYNGLVSATITTTCPSYVALNFKLVRESLATRNGSKRIGGLAETSVSGNAFNFASPTVKGEILTALATDLHDGPVIIAAPVIVRRPLATPAGLSYVYSNVSAATTTEVLTTQNTRKVGHGI